MKTLRPQNSLLTPVQHSFNTYEDVEKAVLYWYGNVEIDRDTLNKAEMRLMRGEKPE